MDRTPVQNVARLVGVVFLLVGTPASSRHHHEPLRRARVRRHRRRRRAPRHLRGQRPAQHRARALRARRPGAGRNASGARTFLVGGGAIYIVLWLLGCSAAPTGSRRTPPMTGLHLVLGVGMIGLGLAHARATRPDDRVAGQRSGNGGRTRSAPRLVHPPRITHRGGASLRGARRQTPCAFVSPSSCPCSSRSHCPCRPRPPS